MTYRTTMTSKGQITIPADVRRSLVLQPGDSVIIDLNQNGDALIKKNDWDERWEQTHALVAAHFKKRNIEPLSDEELDEAIDVAGRAAAHQRHTGSID